MAGRLGVSQMTNSGSTSDTPAWADLYANTVRDGVTGYVEVLRGANDLLVQRAAPRGTADVLAPAGDAVTAWLSFAAKSYASYSRSALGYWNDVLRAANDALRSGATAFGEPPMAVAIEAEQGETATATFAIVNPSSAPVAVTFDATQPIAHDGSALAADTISFDPPVLRLEPGARGVVTVIATIRAVALAGTYYAPIRAIGLPGPDAAISVTVCSAKPSA